MILDLIRAGDKLLRQRELARRLGGETSSVVRVLDMLEESGHVERLPDPADRRAKQLRLTVEGRRIGHTAERIVTSLRYQLSSGVSRGELESMHRVLLKFPTTLHRLVRP
ncbi:MarR family winged helix-turn-helix transcriptional regulator [Pseudomonas sp. NGC7]|uniref:MarR family winged helix-turn-helix transcriptional regulator n=1 Tax=Pseudomonas sp. NGC7 TaxID=3341775 RepID=UPI00399D411F